MRVVYDSIQDLILILTEEEKIILTENFTTEFYENPIRGFSDGLGSYVYLAHSKDNPGIFKNSENLDRMGRIIIPRPEDISYPWLINLSDEGIRHLRNGWNYGIRYNGSNKLFIKLTEFLK